MRQHSGARAHRKAGTLPVNTERSGRELPKSLTVRSVPILSRGRRPHRSPSRREVEIVDGVPCRLRASENLQGCGMHADPRRSAGTATLTWVIRGDWATYERSQEETSMYGEPNGEKVRTMQGAITSTASEFAERASRRRRSAWWRATGATLPFSPHAGEPVLLPRTRRNLSSGPSRSDATPQDVPRYSSMICTPKRGKPSEPELYEAPTHFTRS